MTYQLHMQVNALKNTQPFMHLETVKSISMALCLESNQMICQMTVTNNSATAILTKQKSETYDISGGIIRPFSHTALLFAEQ